MIQFLAVSRGDGTIHGQGDRWIVRIFYKRFFHRGGPDRQENLERRPLADFARELNPAAVPAHDALDHPKSQAGAFADVFCGEEWIIYSFQMFGRDAGTGVGDDGFDMTVNHRSHAQMSAAGLT